MLRIRPLSVSSCLEVWLEAPVFRTGVQVDMVPGLTIDIQRVNQYERRLSAAQCRKPASTLNADRRDNVLTQLTRHTLLLINPQR